MKKATTFEDLVIAAERTTRKAAAIDAAKKAMSGIAWAEPDVIKDPGLRAEMARFGDNAETLSKVLNISVDSVRRRLRGEYEFDINEIRILMNRYGKTFEELFSTAERVTA